MRIPNNTTDYDCDFMKGNRIPVQSNQPTDENGICDYCRHKEGEDHADDCIIYGMVLLAEVAKDRIKG